MLLRQTSGFWGGEYGFSALGVDAVPGNGCGIQGQSYVELLRGSETIAEYLYGNWVLFILCFRLTTLNLS